MIDPPSDSKKRQQYKKCMINQLDQEVKVEYAKFTTELLKLFKDKGVLVNDAIFTFVGLGDESSLTSDMQEAKDIQEFLTSLKRTQSWYDFGIMASMATMLGGDKGEKIVNSYEAKLKSHLIKRRKVYVRKSKKVAIKVDESMESIEKKVVAFRNTIVRLLDIEQKELVLKSIKKGCVELTFLFPYTLAPKVKNRIMACTDELKKLRVISVHIEK